MKHTKHGARPSRARSVWLRVVLALGLLFGMGNAAAQCALSGTVATPYSQSFNVTGGTAPYTWSISAGALPAGLALTYSGPDALISGTPSAGGNFSFTLKVVHATGSGTLACTLAVSPPSMVLGPPSLAPATWGTPYSNTVAASGGTAPYTYAVTSGTLPPGMTLGATGALSGTPTAAGTFPFTVTATDNSTGTGPYTTSRSYTFAVMPPTIDMTPASLSVATVGQAYNQVLTGSGGTAPYSYALSSGALPPGLSLSATGGIAGTPTAGGSFDFSVTATDANGFTGTRSFTLGVAAPAIAIAPATLANAVAGTAYAQSISASGGTAPYGYALLAGALPTGMTLSSTGTLSGTPTVAGSFDFTVEATDSSTGSGPYVAQGAYTLVVDAPTITVTPSTLPSGMAGTAYPAQALAASGGVAPYTWSLVGGSLPAGMSFSSAGVLSGTPTVAGSFDFTVRATDANGFGADQAYTLAIAAPTITVTPSTLPAASAEAAYSQSLAASGGVAPYTWSLASGSLPAGMALSSPGVLSGTPTVAGSFNFTVRATDANGFTADQAYALAIAAPTIALTPTTLPAATAATSYSQALTASGGVAPYNYAVSAGALPAGITLSASGAIAGTPTAVGNFSFTIRATDTHGFAGQQAYTLAIAALVPVAGNDSARTTATQAVTVNVTANDTNGPFTAANVLSVTPLDAGTATIAQSGGAWLLTFVPAADFSGTASVRYTVSNAYATSAAATLEVIVESRPDPSRDPDVLGLLSAQANATRGFARAQLQNVQQRLESLHGGADGNGWHNGLSLARPTGCDRTMTGAAATCTQWQDTDAATPAATQPSSAPIGLWTAGSFGSGDRDFRFGRSAMDFETSGISVGADYRVSGTFVLGTALGYGRDRTHVGVRDTRADGESYSAMAYASWSPSAATFVDAVFGYQRLSFDTRRTVAANGATVVGSRDGAQWFGSLATGYEYRDGGTLVAPYGRIDLANAELDAYAEHGDAVYALRYGQQDVDTGTASVGLRVEQQVRQEWGMFTPLLRIEHQHDFQGQGSTSLQYADLPAGPFYRAFGDTFDRSRWLLGLGTGFTFSDALGLKFEYMYIGDGSNQDRSIRVILQGRF